MIDGYVYKQTAIDALAKAMPSLTTPDGCGEFDHDIQIADEAFVDSMQIIHGLPSADVQPVIRCKDCKWCVDADGLMCKNVKSWVVATEPSFGCVYGERKESEQHESVDS